MLVCSFYQVTNFAWLNTIFRSTLCSLRYVAWGETASGRCVPCSRLAEHCADSTPHGEVPENGVIVLRWLHFFYSHWLQVRISLSCSLHSVDHNRMLYSSLLCQGIFVAGGIKAKLHCRYFATQVFLEGNPNVSWWRNTTAIQFYC